MKQKSIESISNKDSGLESFILLILLAVICVLFTISAFIKTDYFWGINYLYYFPLWVKILFISIGGFVFLPPFNSAIHRIFRKTATLIDLLYKKTEKRLIHIFYLIYN